MWNWRLGGAYATVVPGAVRSAIARRVVPALPEPAQHYARRSFLAVGHTPEEAFFDNFAAIPLSLQQRLLSPALAASATPAGAYAASLEWFGRASGASLLDRVLYTDIKTYLVELLMKQDQMSMAASIESRVPFLDHTLVEFAARLPARWKLNGLTTKRVLRAAARGLLPREILERPKMGFPVPVGQWLRGPWGNVVRDVLLDRRSRERGLISAPAVEALLRDHRVGAVRATDALWGLLNLELWYRTFIDGEGVQDLGRPSAGRVPAGDAPALADASEEALPRSSVTRPRDMKILRLGSGALLPLVLRRAAPPARAHPPLWGAAAPSPGHAAAFEAGGGPREASPSNDARFSS